MFLNWSLGLNIDFGFTGPVDMRILMLIYSFGYFMVNLIMGLLYKHAYNHHELLELNNVEKKSTRGFISVNIIMMSYAFLSILIAFFSFNIFTMSLSGWIYFGIGPTIFIYFYLSAKSQKS